MTLPRNQLWEAMCWELVKSIARISPILGIPLLFPHVTSRRATYRPQPTSIARPPGSASSSTACLGARISRRMDQNPRNPPCFQHPVCSSPLAGTVWWIDDKLSPVAVEHGASTRYSLSGRASVDITNHCLYPKEGWYHAILSPSVFMCFPCTWNISINDRSRTQNSRCPGGQVLVTVGFLSNLLKKDKKPKFRDDFSPCLLLIFPFQRCFAALFCPIFRFRCHIRPTGTACLGV